MENHILIIEDDDNLRDSLVDNLEIEGYQVHSFALIEAGRQWLSNNNVDLVILDIMLPDGDGYELAKWIRTHCDVLILMLTARSLEKDVVEGFISGADDYVSKPYRVNELLLRIKALLRRKSKTSIAQVTMINDYSVNWQLRKIQHNEKDIHLTKTAFDILSYLFEHMNTTCSREQILDAVWGENVYVDNRTIDNFIYNLKKQLALTNGTQHQIKTIRGIGYSLTTQ
ncbi:response regulator transcription factor [Paraglaciecola sp. L3A3]|uniref:response regulator transcription factor n=1 Tax=Paraglaciecola sp. L3A3 TaxID=2686358 RepID=UPI00131C6E79|nr:response regulator transcription factor [Paraglaciecola sp. L3A3]